MSLIRKIYHLKLSAIINCQLSTAIINRNIFSSYDGMASNIVCISEYFKTLGTSWQHYYRQACRYCFYSVVQKWVFRPAGATRCPDKREIWHGGPLPPCGGPLPPCQTSRLSGRKCGNTAPKTVKISNFGQKFVPQGRLVCNIFTKFSAFVGVCR